MSGRLTVTSGELRSTAGDMRSTASNISQELQRMMGKVRELTGSWTGQEFNKSWSQCQQALEGVSQLLARAADAYDEAERNIASQFQR